MGIRVLVLSVLVGSIVASAAPAQARRPGRHSRASRSIAPVLRDGRPNIQAQAAVIVDIGPGGSDLYAKNADAVRPIASISKLMAVLVVMDRGLKLEGTTVITKDDKRVAWKGARSRLMEGMELSNRDLLHAALIASDNRAIPALGRAVGLSPEQLAAEMSKKARAMGLHHTDFRDPTGLDDGNVSTPRETIKMLQAVLANPTLAEILKKPHYVAQPVNKGGRHGLIEYTNTDKLVQAGRWQVLGGKTGYTDIARYCLVVAAKLGDREVAMAFLGAEGKLTRFGDFTRSAEWMARQNFRPAPAEPTASAAPAAPAPAPATVAPAAPAAAHP
jgi:serine-type D-Ala-D-Ala endopeptidase (penicillin-binding protein 7)